MMKIFFFTALILCSLPIFSQTKTIDSLRKQVNHYKNIAEKNKNIHLLLRQHRSMSRGDHTKAQPYNS